MSSVPASIWRALAVAVAATALALALPAAAGAAQEGSADRAAQATTFHGKGGKGRFVYDRLWRKQVSQANKRWARRVSECESGRRPTALSAGGRYRGAFQFSRATWRTAPKSPGGDPVSYSYRTQAFVAVRLKTRDGKGHWPNCG